MDVFSNYFCVRGVCHHNLFVCTVSAGIHSITSDSTKNHKDHNTFTLWNELIRKTPTTSIVFFPRLQQGFGFIIISNKLYTTMIYAYVYKIMCVYDPYKTEEVSSIPVVMMIAGVVVIVLKYRVVE